MGYRLIHICMAVFLLAPWALGAARRSSKKTKTAALVAGGKALEKPESYMASVRSISGTHECGGTLIHPKAVLTAAHCIKHGRSLDVDVGRLMRIGLDEGSGFESFKTAHVIVHESYDPETYDYDIALLILDRAAASHYPLPLASSDSCFKGQEGCSVRLLGWGATSEGGYLSPVLQEAYTRGVGRKKCEPLLQGAVVAESMICAGAVENGEQDSCPGDSGGPLMLNGKLVGVVSSGIGCGKAQSPGLYISVPTVRSWIDAKLSEIDSPTPPDPCNCSENGISNGVQTHRFGCKQHLLSAGDLEYFCMTIGGMTCSRAQASEEYEGAAWILCG